MRVDDEDCVGEWQTYRKKTASKNKSSVSKESYHTVNHTQVYVNKMASVRGYKVLTYKESAMGRTVLDILDGKVYYCGVGINRRITNDGIMFGSKSAALNERFPPNELSRYPRILVAFGEYSHQA